MSDKEINIDWNKYIRTGRLEEKKIPFKLNDPVRFKDNQGTEIVGRIIQKSDRVVLQVLDTKGMIYVVDQSSVQAIVKDTK